MAIAVLWDVTSCSLAQTCSFGGECCLHPQGEKLEAAGSAEMSEDCYHATLRYIKK